MHFSRQLNCWSLRCSWSIVCRRCSNYIFILQWTLGFNLWDKDNCKPRWETLKFWDLAHLRNVMVVYNQLKSAMKRVGVMTSSCIWNIFLFIFRSYLTEYIKTTYVCSKAWRSIRFFFLMWKKLTTKPSVHQQLKSLEFQFCWGMTMSECKTLLKKWIVIQAEAA